MTNTNGLESALSILMVSSGFNPMEEALFVGIDMIKDKRRQPNFWIDKHAKKQPINPEDYFGVVSRTDNNLIMFSYGRKDLVDKRMPLFQEKNHSVLYIFQGVSFEAFTIAAERYKFRQSVEEVERYLSYGG